MGNAKIESSHSDKAGEGEQIAPRHVFVQHENSTSNHTVMAVGRAVLRCILILVFLDLLGTYERNTNIHMWCSHPRQNPARIPERFLHKDDTCNILPMISAHVWRHFGFHRPRLGKFLGCRLSRYSNSTSTFQVNRFFQLNRVLSSWDIHMNPGPSTTKPCCPACSRTIARNHRSVDCNSCGGMFHIKCGKVTPKQFKQMKKSDPIRWTCPVCIDKFITQGDVNSEYRSALPFASVANLSTLAVDGFEGLDTSEHYDQDFSGDYLTALLR